MSRLDVITKRPRARRGLAGWIDAIRSRVLTFAPGAQKDPALARLMGMMGGAVAPSGVAVTPETAFTYSAVWDAVSQISADVAKVPLVLYKRGENGTREPYVDSKTYKILHDEWNPEMSSFQARRAVTAHALTWGNGYAEIERDGAGRPWALWPITPDRVTVVRVRRPGAARSELVYEIDGGRTRLAAADVLHLAGPGFNGVTGYNVIEFARVALGIALAAEQFVSAFFGNGTAFGGVLSSDQDVDPETATEIRERIESIHKAADKAHRFLILGGGFKYSKLAVDPSSAQLKEAREQQAIAVANYWNIPLHKIKSLERATNNNIEHQDLEYYKGCLLNWFTAWEQEYNRKLIPRLEYRRAFTKHNVEGFLRADVKTRNEALQIQRANGVINADEWRELEDRNPIPDGGGKVYIIQSGFVPLGKLEAMAEARITKESAPAATSAPAPRPEGAEDEESEAERALRARVERAEAMAETARAEAEESRARVIALEATGQAAGAELERLRASDAERAGLALALTVSADGLRAELEAIRAQRIAEQDRIAELEEAERQALEAAAAESGRRSASEARIAELEAALEAARAEGQALGADAERRRAELVQAADIMSRRIVELEGALEERRRRLGEAERARAARILASHRALVHDVMRRMIEREAERAARIVGGHGGNVGAILDRLEAFYGSHAEVLGAALTPAIRAHLAYIGSPADPAALVGELVREHVAESIGQVRAVLEGDAGEVAESFPELFRRWAAERPEAVADRILQRGIDAATE